MTLNRIILQSSSFSPQTAVGMCVVVPCSGLKCTWFPHMDTIGVWKWMKLGLKRASGCMWTLIRLWRANNGWEYCPNWCLFIGLWVFSFCFFNLNKISGAPQPNGAAEFLEDSEKAPFRVIQVPWKLSFVWEKMLFYLWSLHCGSEHFQLSGWSRAFQLIKSYKQCLFQPI